MPTEEGSRSREHVSRAVSIALVVSAGVLAALLFGGLASGALLGFDAYPLVATVREGGLLGALTEPLMGGRYPDGEFWRPVVHLTFLADDVVSGGAENTNVFRVTDIAISAFAAAVLGAAAVAIASRVTKREGVEINTVALVGCGVAAVATYLGHASQLEAVPYAPRRAEGLAMLFTGTAVLLALRDARPVWLGIATLLAVLSKETGVIAVPLVFVAALVRDPKQGAKGAALTCAVPAAAVLLCVILRLAVLGGIGGHAESGASAAFSGVLGTLGEAWSLFASGVPGGAGVAALLLAVTLAAAARHSVGAIALGLAWLALSLGLTAFSGRMHAWYLVAFLPAVAIPSGVAVCGALSTRSRFAWVGGGAAASLAMLFALGSISSPQRDTIRVASSIAADQIRRFDATLRTVQPGGRAYFEPWVFATQMSPDSPPVFLHAGYSLKAYAELARPELDAVVQVSGSEAAGAGTFILLIPGAPPNSAVPR